MAVLSIQSWVSYGHVGNAIVVFALQRLGMEVWAVNTVNFSNHPGYGAWTGEAVTGPVVTSLVDGVADRGVLGQCQAVLAGYLGRSEIGQAVLHAAARVRAANPAALYCCDPVIGDAGPGRYVDADTASFIRDRCVAEADILTPNHFELEYLVGRRVSTLAEAKQACAGLRAGMRPGAVVLVTSLGTEQTPADAVDLLVADAAGCHLVRAAKLPIVASGSGDLIAAVFLFHLLRGGDPATAAARAASVVFGVLRQTLLAGSRELLIVAAQQEIVAPSQKFTAAAC